MPSRKNSAGLAIHETSLRFVELNEEGRVSRKTSVSLPEGCVVNGSIQDFTLLEEALKSLQKKTGKIRHPVTIGLPSGDTVIRRTITFPRMGIEDIRSSIDLNFEEYFTSRADTIFDAVIITTPNDPGNKDTVSVMAATAKKSVVDKILEIAKRTDIILEAVEPLNFAMLRAVPELKEGLCLFVNPHDITATWQGHGIFFRTVGKVSSQDVLNTIQFIKTQYRRVQVNKIILEEVDLQFGEDIEANVVSVDDPFYAAMGLALREDGLDLRLSEYVELERRRRSFNPNRLLLWGLLLGFLVMSTATAFYAFFKNHRMNEDIKELQGIIDSLALRQQELERDNSRLEGQKQRTEKIINFLKDDMPILEVLNAFEVNIPNGTKFDNAEFTREPSGEVKVIVDGTARDDRDIITMTEGLKEGGLFESVTIPFSQKDNLRRTVFKMVLIVKNMTSVRTEAE